MMFFSFIYIYRGSICVYAVMNTVGGRTEYRTVFRKVWDFFIDKRLTLEGIPVKKVRISIMLYAKIHLILNF